MFGIKIFVVYTKQNDMTNLGENGTYTNSEKIKYTVCDYYEAKIVNSLFGIMISVTINRLCI